MAVPEHCVTGPSPSADDSRSRRRRASAAGALALVLGCVISAPAVLAQSSPALAGKWQLSCTGRKGQTRQISLDIGQQGATLSGSYTAPSRSGKLQGSVQGNQVSLELQGRFRRVKLTGTADGNTLQVQTAKGVSCTGTRHQVPP
jgi:hypothetical protein